MMFAGHFFILASYAVVSAVIALVLPQSVSFIDTMTASVIGVCVFLAAALLHESVARRREVQTMAQELVAAWQAQAGEIDFLRDCNGELSRRLDATSSELNELRQAIGQTAERANEIVVAEMKVLQNQLNDISVRRRQSDSPPADDEPDNPDAADAEPAVIALPQVIEPPADDAAIVQMVLRGLEQNRVDVYLQPIVSLPQRKTRFYEAFSRIRTEDGRIMLPEHYLALAEERGLISVIDNLLLFRCVQLIRKVKKRSLDVGFFVNIASHTLSDENFLAQFTDFMEMNAELADCMILELSQADVADCWPAVTDRMAHLVRLGFRFSMDQLTSLDIDYEELGRRRFKFVKSPVDLLLRGTGADIHPMDLKQALARPRIDLIVDKIETERSVAELLDYDVDFGQGYLFGEPRPSRDGF